VKERLWPPAKRKQSGSRRREVSAALGQEVPRRLYVVQAFEQTRRRAFAAQTHHTGHAMNVPAVVHSSFQKLRYNSFALAPHDAVQGAARVLQHLLPREGKAVAAREEETVGQPSARLYRQIDHLGDVRQIVQRIADGLGAPIVEHPKIVCVAEHLKIQDADCVADCAC